MPLPARTHRSVRRASARWLVAVLALLTAALGVAFPSPLHAEIVVAVAAPLSGPQADEGRGVIQSAQWAIDEINGRGGLASQRLRLVSLDDGCDERRAEAAAVALQAERPALVVGHPCGAAALAAARVYAAAGLLFIATAPRHPDLTRKRAGNTVFRLAGRDDLQAASTASYLVSAYAGRKLAIVHDRTRYARTLVQGLRDALGQSFGASIPEFGIVAGNKDFGAAVAGLAAHRPGVVYFAGFPAEALAIWSQLRGAGIAADLVGSDALANAEAELHDARAASATGGTLRVVRPYSPLEAASARTLADRLAAARLPLSAGAVAAHAAVEAWSIAARDVGDVAPAATAARLSGQPLATSALGPLSFDADGNAKLSSYAIATFEGGRLEATAIVLPEPRFTTTGEAVTRINGAVPPRGGTALDAVRDIGVGGAAPGTSFAGLRPPPLPARHPRRSRPRSR